MVEKRQFDEYTGRVARLLYSYSDAVDCKRNAYVAMKLQQ